MPITIHSVHDLSGALDSASKFEVVFLDLEFPNHSGFDLVKKLKKDKRLQATPIIAYSVHTSEINEVRTAGFDGFIGKPLSVDQFPNQLRRILSGESVWEVGA
jgi:two-component system cell cycle response regulator DivK